MRRFIVFGFACVTLSLFLSCKDSSTQPEKQVSRAELTDPFRGFGPATNGGRLADVVAEFGDPASSHSFEGTNYLTFFIDQSPQVPQGLVGISLRERDGVVFNVQPITGDPIPFTKAQRAAAKNFNITPRDIVFKIGDSAVKVHPKEVLPHKYSEQSNEQANLHVTRALIDFSNEDALRIQLFTSTNVGNTIQLYLDDQLISQFPIRDEIKTNEIEIELKEPGIPLEQLFSIQPVGASNAPVQN